jgi:hypothetical protein
MKTAGPLQYLPIPTWKWEDISIDFTVGFPKTVKGFDSVWVIIDRLTKIAHFLPVKVKYIVTTYAELYIARILSLHGCHTRFLEGKPNANHVRARISYSRTQQLHNMDIITQCSK